MITFSSKALGYFNKLEIPSKKPKSVELLNPYKSKEVKIIVNSFFNRYYNDNKNRTYVLGINPGRFGGGITGISFTDPVALRDNCGIDNSLGNKKELSSEFIYLMIEKYGGTKKFFSDFYMSALYPLAFIKNGKNYNYYDAKELWKFSKPLIAESISRQIDFGCNKNVVISLGKKNAEFLSKINDEYNFFKEIKILEHPRFIMQYRRKKLDKFIEKYLNLLNNSKPD